MRLTARRIRTLDLSGVRNLHGLTTEEYRQILTVQKGKCALSDIQFSYDPAKKKIVDPVTGRAPCIDHDHQTGYVRGILSSKLNLLADQWVNKSYGSLPEPLRIRNYRHRYPAQCLEESCLYK